MRNKIDFSLPPEELFLDPARDPGLTFLRRPDFIWRLHDRGRIEGFSVSDHDQIRLRTDRFIRYTRQHKTFRQAVEFNSVLVQLDQASFRKSYALAQGKCLLNGAGGARLLNRYCWENEASPDTGDSPESRLIRYFHSRQATNRIQDLPVLSTPPAPDLDFAIECRNTFNYFHFLTETLCHLCLLADIDFRGRIFLHFPNAEDKTRPFVQAFADALFPEFRGRIFLERAPKEYDRVLTAYHLFNSYYLLPPEVTQPIEDLSPSDEMWKGAEASRSSQAVLSMNSLDSSLIRLRDRALAAIKGRDFSHLPRRFYAGRRPDAARRRDVEGEAELLDLLRAMGFAEIAFEDLAPLDQIGLMAHAEIMVTPHGAGLTNMLFASPDTLVVELGTLQTAIYRWGDFWPLATVSGCRYVNFFADYNQPDPLADPSFSVDGIVPVALGRRGLGEVLAYIAAVTGRIPRLSRAEDVTRLVQKLSRTGFDDRALQVMTRHEDLVAASPDLALAAAEMHKTRGETAAELLALTRAWEADTTRWQTLVQIIWCARKLDNTDVLGWAVRLLGDHFPDRCLEVVRGRPWLRRFL